MWWSKNDGENMWTWFEYHFHKLLEAPLEYMTSYRTSCNGDSPGCCEYIAAAEHLWMSKPAPTHGGCGRGDRVPKPQMARSLILMKGPLAASKPRIFGPFRFFSVGQCKHVTAHVKKATVFTPGWLNKTPSPMIPHASKWPLIPRWGRIQTGREEGRGRWMYM